MAAAPFVATLQTKGMKSGKLFPYYCTVSDVNAEFYIFPSGDSSVVLAAEPLLLYDVMLSAAGTDTKTASVFLGGIDTGIKIVNASNISTVQQRQVNQAPIMIPAGVSLKIKQNT